MPLKSPLHKHASHAGLPYLKYIVVAILIYTSTLYYLVTSRDPSPDSPITSFTSPELANPFMNYSLRIPSSLQNETTYAIFVNTFKRPKTLAKYLEYYSNPVSGCKRLEGIWVLWGETDVEPPKEMSTSFVRVIRSTTSSLNERFKWPPANMAPKSKAILSSDDDMAVSCSDLEFGFDVWKEFPDRIVGYAPRNQIQKVPLEYDEQGYTKYQYIWNETLASYNIILTNLSFLHREYLSLYWMDHPLFAAYRQHVSLHINCEDIAMNFMVALATRGKAPIYVKSAFRVRMDNRAISHKPGHNENRSKCSTLFTGLSLAQGFGAPLDAIRATWSFSQNADNKIQFIQ